MKKVDCSCPDCDADYIIRHDLMFPYALLYCPFCGERIHEDEIEFDELYHDDDDEYNVSDW